MKTVNRLPALCGVTLLLAWALGGCSGYRLQGVVIEGPEPGIEVVGADDPRLGQAGLASTQIEVLLDPHRLRPETIGRGESGRDGTFALPIDEPGAGFLILDVEVQAKRQRYRSQVKRMTLPGAHERLVITLESGRDTKALESPDVLDETLRQAEPFLRR